MSSISRRRFLSSSSAASTLLLLPNARGGQEPQFEGIFPIVQTPFTDSDALDTETLAREIQFLHRSGVQGLTWPQNASEYINLTWDERIAGAETIVKANN